MLTVISQPSVIEVMASLAAVVGGFGAVVSWFAAYLSNSRMRQQLEWTTMALEREAVPFRKTELEKAREQATAVLFASSYAPKSRFYFWWVIILVCSISVIPDYRVPMRDTLHLAFMYLFFGSLGLSRNRYAHFKHVLAKKLFLMELEHFPSQTQIRDAYSESATWGSFFVNFGTILLIPGVGGLLQFAFWDQGLEHTPGWALGVAFLSGVIGIACAVQYFDYFGQRIQFAVELFNSTLQSSKETTETSENSGSDNVEFE